MAEKEGRWITVKGRRVFIQDGETPSEAIERSKKEYTKKSVGKKYDPFSKESLYKTRKKSFSEKIDENTTFEEYYKHKFGEDYSDEMDEDEEIEEARKEFERMKHEVLAEKKDARGGFESDLDMRDRVAEDKAALDKKAWEEVLKNEGSADIKKLSQFLGKKLLPPKDWNGGKGKKKR